MNPLSLNEKDIYLRFSVKFGGLKSSVLSICWSKCCAIFCTLYLTRSSIFERCGSIQISKRSNNHSNLICGKLCVADKFPTRIIFSSSCSDFRSESNGIFVLGVVCFLFFRQTSTSLAIFDGFFNIIKKVLLS